MVKFNYVNQVVNRKVGSNWIFMNYLKLKEIYYTEHNFVYSCATRNWFLSSDDMKVRKWRNLSTYRYFKEPYAVPTEKLDLIEIENYKEEKFDYDLVMPEGRLIDFFSIGIYFFVSERMMLVLKKNDIEAYFSEARIRIDGIEYKEPYFLFTPRDMLAAFDEVNSVFTTELDLGGDEVISNVNKYCLDYNKIPNDQKLFYLLVKGKRRPLMIREDVANEIIKANITGIDFVKVEDM